MAAFCDPCKSLECTNPVYFDTFSLQSGLVFAAGVLSAVVACPENRICVPGTYPRTFTYGCTGPGCRDGPPPIIVPPGAEQIILKGCSSDIVRSVDVGSSEAFLRSVADDMFGEWAQQQAECDAEDDPNNRPRPEPPSLTMTSLSPTITCADVAYSGTVSSNNTSTTFSIIGTLPTGLALTQAAGVATISGTPTVEQTFLFVIQATAGSVTIYQQVAFVVAGLTTASPLPDGNFGVAYSETIEAAGIDSPAFSVTSGTLPDGLTLNSSTGEISGTPINTADTFTFTVTATGANITCAKQYVIDVPGAPYQDLVWSQVALVQVGTGTATFAPSPGGTGQNFSSLCTCNDAGVGSQGRATYDADMVYAGPNISGSVNMTIVNNEVIADPGINSLTVTFFINGMAQTSVNMPQGFNGPLALPFTAMAGALKFRVDVLALAGVNLSISCVGVIVNV